MAAVGATVPSAANRWYVLAILMFAQACHVLDRTIISIALEPLKRDFALSDRQLGLLAGLVYSCAYTLAAIPFGLAVDRFQRRYVLTAALTMWSGFTALCGLAQGYMALLLGRAAVGAAEAGGSPTGMSMISDYFGPEERATAISFWYVANGIGAILAFLGGGYVIQHYGWRTGFLMAGIPGLLIALAVILTVREPVRGGMDHRPHDMPQGRWHVELRAILRQPAQIHAMLGTVFTAIPAAGAAAWISSFFVRVHGFDLTHTGFIAALGFGVFGTAGGLTLGLLVDRRNRKSGYHPAFAARASIVTPLAAAVLGIAMVGVQSAAAAIALMMAFTFFQASHLGVANSLVVSLAAPRTRGTVISLLQIATNLVGSGLGPLLVGAVSQGFATVDGLRWGIAAAIAFNLPAAFHFWRSAHRLARP